MNSEKKRRLTFDEVLKYLGSMYFSFIQQSSQLVCLFFLPLLFIFSFFLTSSMSCSTILLYLLPIIGRTTTPICFSCEQRKEEALLALCLNAVYIFNDIKMLSTLFNIAQVRSTQCFKYNYLVYRKHFSTKCPLCALEYIFFNSISLSPSLCELLILYTRSC